MEDEKEGVVHVVSHQDLFDKIQELEKMVRGWFVKAAMFALPFVVSSVLWVWRVEADQQAFNADINARVQGNQQAYGEARATQHRIESRLNEINLFLREDSKELRQDLKDHTKTNHGK